MQSSASLREFGRYASLNILGMAGISCYILADTFFVARGTGSTGLAALNIAIPAFNLMNGIGLMIGVGGATLFTLRRAQGEPEEADRVFTHAAVLALALGLLWSLIGLTAAGPISRLLGADAATFPLASVYLRVLLGFGPFFMLNNLLIAFVRNDGGPGRAMCAMIAGSLFNIVFDYIFIFPCGLGMFGAALATGVSPIVSILTLSGHLRAPSRGFRLKKTAPLPRLLPAICAPGLTSIIGEVASGVVLLLFNLVLLDLTGNTGVAAYGVVANLALVAVAVFTGLSTGMQPLVSRVSGAGDRAAQGRLLRWGVVTALGIAAALYALVFVFASPIAAAFNSENDPALAAYAVQGLRIYFTGFAFAGFNIVTAAFFSASGRAGQGFAVSLVRGVIAVPPLLFPLAAALGVAGVWLTFPAVEGVTAVLAGALIWRMMREHG